MNQKRKILLAVSGMSPQIVTETLYALVTRERPWIPDEIILLSTLDGCDRARNELLHESRNMFGKFCEEYLPNNPVKFDETCLRSFGGLRDISTLEDSALVADEITKQVYQLTSDDNTEIHASIAGGRKSMGFLLGYAMSMYGRSQDRLSHVLVSEGFEGNLNFFYPPKKSTIIYGQGNHPLDTNNAKIMLAEIPILHLRHRLPKDMLKEVVSFNNLISIMNLSLAEPSLTVDVENRTLICHGEKKVKLGAEIFAFYLFMLKNGREKYLSSKSISDKQWSVLTNDKFGNTPEERKNIFSNRRRDIKEKLEKELKYLASHYVLQKNNLPLVAKDKIEIINDPYNTFGNITHIGNFHRIQG